VNDLTQSQFAYVICRYDHGHKLAALKGWTFGRPIVYAVHVVREDTASSSLSYETTIKQSFMANFMAM
jgi:hypothetical protein